MADFCWDCTEEMFGPESAPVNDFRHLISEEEHKRDYVMEVLCEGCGFIRVDHNGKRVYRV